jgi:hypothetical protein
LAPTTAWRRYQLPLASRVLSPPAKNLLPEQVSQRQAAAAAALEHQANLAKHGVHGSTTDFKWLADVLKKVPTPRTRRCRCHKV